MKYAVFFLLCLVALAAAAPQFITTVPGYVAPGIAPYGTWGARVFFLLCLVALTAAAPQFITTVPGYVAPGIAPYGTWGARTLVAGPTVVNGFGARYVAPGYVGPAYF